MKLHLLFYGQIKSMKELYFADLTELYQKIVLKLQQVFEFLICGSLSFKIHRISENKMKLIW